MNLTAVAPALRYLFLPDAKRKTVQSLASPLLPPASPPTHLAAPDHLTT